MASIWMRQTEHDLDTARYLMRDGRYSDVCFTAQQVAEKTLKALAYYRGDSDVIGHTLIALAISLEKSYPELSRFHGIVESLGPYYIQTRYPDALPSGAPFEVYMYDEADEALYNAEQFYNFGRSIIPS